MLAYLVRTLLIILSIPILIINWLCLALDNLFYPRFRKTEIKPPVFIIGMFRTATTLCQNLMINDTHHFTYFKFYELLFAPSVIQKKLVNQVIRLDKKMNGAIYKIASRIDRLIFLTLENHHPMRLLTMEEDHFMYCNTLTAPALWMLAPGVFKQYTVLKRYDDQMPGRIRKFDMYFYKTCIRRHLYVYGRGRKYLSKSPPNSIRIRTLQATFPGCQFIYMVRDPLYVTASSICLFVQFRKLLLLETDIKYMTSVSFEMTDLFYKYPLLECSDLKGKVLFIITFNELIRDAYSTIHKLYDNLGIDITDEFERFLLNSQSMVSNHKTKNKYDPEQFGLTHEMFRKRFDYIYRDFPDLTT
jgi:omega-hydroxy-beta-dihydromenaquinone-9 sulfotransferase